jgi:hypothetical protein
MNAALLYFGNFIDTAEAGIVDILLVRSPPRE